MELEVPVHLLSDLTTRKGTEVQGPPGLQSKFRANLGDSMRPCLQVKSKKEKSWDIAQ